MKAGDWVQALEEQTEEDFQGHRLWVHARKNAVGHVMGVCGDRVTITWERTGTTTDCDPLELKWLGSADTGRFPMPALKLLP